MNHKATTLGVVLLVTLAAVAPATALSLGPLGEDTTPPLATSGGNPTFIVEFDNESTTAATAIETWADSRGDRSLVSIDNSTGQAVVAAPRWQVDLSTIDALLGGHTAVLTTDQLDEKGYVDEVHPNYLLELPEPVTTPLTSAEFATPTIGTLAINDPAFATEGLAFGDDVNATSMAPVREITGGANLSDSANGTGQLVAAIDTGANVANGRVAGNSTPGSDVRIHNASKSFISNESVNATAGDWDAIADGNGHGTWVTSALIGNATNGTHDSLAPNATALVLKALADDGSGSTADIANAIRYAADHNADVISMSLGSPVWPQPIVEAIDYAHTNGVKAVVVAAGNSRLQRGAGVASPGDYDPVISVGATNSSEAATPGAGDVWSAYFSQVGPDPGTTDDSAARSVDAMPDVVAPGFKVTARVATTGGSVTNATLSGTSMATPIVASALLAAMSTNSTLSTAGNGTVHGMVRQSARAAPNLATVEAGHGMVAADNLADGTIPERDQADAMTAAAEQRDVFYRKHANAQQRRLAALWRRIGG